jgi:phthiocerol/phenolphthiocerol synthesis type-I polyketide synthase E
MRWRVPATGPKGNFMADTQMLDSGLSFPPHAVAIVGLAGRFPEARNLDAFWDNIATGKESLDTFSDTDLDHAGVDATLRNNPQFVRKGTTLESAELFDAGFFGLSPREAQILDPQHRIFLECAWEALEHAGYAPGTIQQTVGVYAGASMNTYVFAQILRDRALIDAVGGYQLMLGNDKDFLCTRVSYKLDLRGPSMTIQTACSTSLVAVEVACRALHTGECDMALAGGVSLNFPARGGYLYVDGMILSPDGHCRPFDAAAAGTRAGAGAGIVVLKRLQDAIADRDTIHAVIIGAAVNNDGAGKVGYTAPSIDGRGNRDVAGTGWRQSTQYRLHRGARHRDPARRSDRDRRTDSGVPRIHPRCWILSIGIAEGQSGASRCRGGCGRPDQDRTGAQASAHSAAGELPFGQSAA